MKRKFILLSVLMSMVALVSLGSYAYVQRQVIIDNQVSTSEVQIEIIQTDGTSRLENGVQFGAYPSKTIAYQAMIENTGKSRVWVRVKVHPELLPLHLDNSLIDIQFNTTDWTWSEGYYYFQESLEANASSTTIFNGVHFSKDMDNTYMNSRFSLKIEAEAVQSDYNGSSALTASGWSDND